MPSTRTKINNYLRAGLRALGTTLAATLLAGGVALAATTSFGNSTPIQILDGRLSDPYPSQINVQNLSGNITDVDLKLNGYGHTYPDDVAVLLVGPQGQKVQLMNCNGGNTDITGVNLTLDDEAANPLPDDDQITSGAYKPVQGTCGSLGTVTVTFPDPAPAGPYPTNLSTFDNTNPNGTWRLFVLDTAAGDEGQFAGGWSLDITTDGTTPPPAPQPDTTAPRVTSTVPAPGATGVSSSANVTATFSEDMQAQSVNTTTFELFQKGSTTKLGATVSYNATTDKATLDPAGSLKSGVTYKAVVTTGARDLAGNALDQNPTKSGNQPKAWRFKVQ